MMTKINAMMLAVALVFAAGVVQAQVGGEDFYCGGFADGMDVTSASIDDALAVDTCNGFGLDSDFDGWHQGGGDAWETSLQMFESGTNPSSGEDNFWVMYEFPEEVTIDNIHYWNHNEECCTDRGFDEVLIEVSGDGNSFSTVGTFNMNEAPGTDGDYFGEDLAGWSSTDATFILLTGVVNWAGDTADVYAISEIRFDISSGPSLSLNVVGNTYAELGGDITMSANDDMLAPYQWKKDGGDLTDETNATLSLSPTMISDTGSYTLVSDDGAKVAFTSNPVGVSIFAAGSLPVSGLIGLGLLAMASALGGVVALRKKSK